jgi:hypothetical protein
MPFEPISHEEHNRIAANSRTESYRKFKTALAATTISMAYHRSTFVYRNGIGGANAVSTFSVW